MAPPRSTEKKPKPQERNYITPVGFRRLQAEFEKLRLVTRREVVQKLAEAAAEGDRSENAEYIYRKRQLREIDRRIRFLLRRMSLAEVIDPSQHRSDRVCFGAVVTVEDESGKALRYQIVGVDESDPKEGRISWSAPIGRALIGKRIGDVATIRVTSGERELELTAIDFPGGGEAGRDNAGEIVDAQKAARKALEESAAARKAAADAGGGADAREEEEEEEEEDADDVDDDEDDEA